YYCCYCCYYYSLAPNLKNLLNRQGLRTNRIDSQQIYSLVFVFFFRPRSEHPPVLLPVLLALTHSFDVLHNYDEVSRNLFFLLSFTCWLFTFFFLFSFVSFFFRLLFRFCVSTRRFRSTTAFLGCFFFVAFQLFTFFQELILKSQLDLFHISMI